MVAPDETWHIELNEIPADQSTAALQKQNSIHRIKQFLVGLDPVAAAGAWLVRGSSDSVTADLTDNLGAPSDWVSETAGTAHSWIVVRSPVGMFPNSRHIEILLSLDVGPTDTENVRIRFATDQDGFDLTSPSVLNSPANPTGSGENATAERQFLENNPTLNDHRMHLWRNEAGDFIVTTSQDSNGRVADWGLQCVRNTDDGATVVPSRPDKWPASIGNAANRLGRGFFDRSIWTSGSTATVGNGFTDDGIYRVTASRYVYPSGFGSSPVDFDNSGDDITGEIGRFFMDAYSFAVNHKSYRGRVRDLKFRPNDNGDDNLLESGADAIRYISAGDLWMLTNGGTLFGSV